MVGLTCADARRVLRAEGLSGSRAERRRPPQSEDGNVIEQRPGGRPGGQGQPGGQLSSASFKAPDEPETTTPQTTTPELDPVRVAVLAGGRSSEHDVSLASAEAVRDGPGARGATSPWTCGSPATATWSVDGEPLALTPGGGLLACDVVFPVLHGPYGEDGTVQGLLEALDVPYVGAGVMASAVCMDKVLFKELMAAAGLPQVDYVGLREGDDPAALTRLGLPVFVKPARLGSSVGISKVTEPRSCRRRWRRLRARPAGGGGGHVRGHGGGVLGAGQPRPRGVAAGRDRDRGRLVRLRGQVPGGGHGAGGARPAARRRCASACARWPSRSSAAWTAPGWPGATSSWRTRAATARVLVNELNTMPGFTPTSVYAKLFEAAGLEYPRCWTGCWTWRWSATGASAATRPESAEEAQLLDGGLVLVRAAW